MAVSNGSDEGGCRCLRSPVGRADYSSQRPTTGSPSTIRSTAP